VKRHLEVHPRPPWLLLAAALLAVAACAPRPQPGPRATPPPHFATLREATRAELIAYGQSLQYDTTQPAMDARYLVVPRGGQLTIGPYATLAPEIGAANTHDGLSQGRIFARLTLSEALPEAGLPAGITYVWVDSAGPGLRAMLVPGVDSFPIVPATLSKIPLCLPGLPSCLRAMARFYMPMAPAESLPMGPCHPCDCGWCCGLVMMRDMSGAHARRPAPARVPLKR